MNFSVGDYSFYKQKEHHFPFMINDINQYGFCSLSIKNIF